MSRISELRRRNVFKVAIAYAIIAWLLLQIADVVLPALQMPEWTVGFVAVLLGIGFPIALLLAWAYELTPGGIRLTQSESADGAPVPGAGRSDAVAVTVGALLLAGLAVGLFVWRSGTGGEGTSPAESRRPAIAVMPFESLGGDEEQQIFVDGLAEDLISRLSSWRGFPVISRAGSFNPDLPSDVREVGQFLDALYVVDGSVRVDGDRIRIVAGLTETSSGENLWSGQYDRQRGDVLDLQDEISAQIIGQLNPALLDAESERAVRADPEDLGAWTAAHRGWWYVNRETQESYGEAEDWLERAIDLDPNWGWPHAALSLAHYRELLNQWAASPAESRTAVVEHAEMAVSLDPMDAFAHHALGHALATQGRVEEALSALARGVELNPYDAMANGCYGMQLAAAGHGEEAVDHGLRAISLSPQDPWQYRFALTVARGYFAAGDYAEAETWADRSNQLRPAAAATWHSIASAALNGELDRARQRVADARRAGPLVPLDAIRNGLASSTTPEYVDRLIRGLTLAGYGE